VTAYVSSTKPEGGLFMRNLVLSLIAVFGLFSHEAGAIWDEPYEMPPTSQEVDAYIGDDECGSIDPNQPLEDYIAQYSFCYWWFAQELSWQFWANAYYDTGSPYFWHWYEASYDANEKAEYWFGIHCQYAVNC
jgi:hypothetical protein